MAPFFLSVNLALYFYGITGTIERVKRKKATNDLLIHGAQVCDVATGEFRAADILVRNGHIAAVGHRFRSHRGRTLDARGLFAMPGLIDAHVHLSASGMHCRLDHMPDPLATAMVNAKHLLAHGVTTVRSAGEFGNDITPDVLITRNEALWYFLSPRIISCGNTFVPSTLDIEDKIKVRRAICNRQSKGATWIKFMLGPRDKQACNMLAWLQPYMRRRKLRSFCHVQAPWVAQVIRAGVNSIEHTFFITRHALGLMKRSQFLVPTVAVSEGEGIKPTRMAWQMGVSIGIGSDAGIPGHPFPGALLRELRALVEAVGLPVMGVLKLATMGNARLLGLVKTGQLRKGFDADVVLVGRDPRDSIDALGNVVTVLRKGQVASDRLGRFSDGLGQKYF